MIKSVTAALVLLIGTQVSLSASADQFSDYQQYAAGLKNTPQQAINDYPASSTTIPGYTTNPSQEKYYSGVEAQSTNIDQDAEAAQAQSGTANSPDQGAGAQVENDFLTADQYQINPNAPWVQQGAIAKSDHHDVLYGISDQYVDCQTQQSCQTQSTQKTCTAPVDLGSMSCVSNLVPTATPAKVITKTLVIDVRGLAKSGNPPSGTITVNLGTGHISTSNNQMHASLASNLGMSACAAMSINQQKVVNTNTNTSLQTMPDCDNNMSLSATVNATQAHGAYNAVITLSVDVQAQPTITTAWVSNCENIDQLTQAGVCTVDTTSCTEGASTKTIDGVPVTESCWQQTTNYNCQSGNVPNTCATLDNQGCQQIGSSCIQEQGGTCLAYQKTYDCQSQNCVGTGFICGHNVFCLDGSCAPNTPTQNANMGIDATELDSASQGGQDVDDGHYTTVNEQDIQIYTGTAAHCRDDAAGFSNCCKASGWGQDIGLTKCSDEEKALGMARQKGMAIQVGGEYCADRVMGVCTEHKEGWCYWTDYISYDVQRDGRKQNNGHPPESNPHISWGSNKNPNCVGFTPDQVDQIDFTKVDFTNYEDTVINSTTVPDQAQLQAQIEEEANEDIANNTITSTADQQLAEQKVDASINSMEPSTKKGANQ